MSFNPKYKITDEILNIIAHTMSIREVIEQSGIKPKIELMLIEEARIRNARASCAIDKSRVVFKAVKEIVKNSELDAGDKDRDEVLNYLEALDFIPRYAVQGKLTVEILMDINRRITKPAGGNEKSETLITDQCALERMNEFMSWLDSDNACGINPIILAGITHCQLYNISLFAGGNGRTARFTALLILYKSGFDPRRLFAIDDYYAGDDSAYRAVLEDAEKNGSDMTHWLKYFARGILYSVSETRSAVDKSLYGLKSKFKRRLKPRFAIMYLAGIFTVLFATPSDESIRRGIWFIIAGLIIRGWANGYAIKSEQLTTSGPYAIVRHPLYLGTIFLLLGLIVALKMNYIGAALLTTSILIYYQKIKQEEKTLERKFKTLYIKYKKNVPAIIPSIFPYQNGEKWTFSFRRLIKSREYRLFIWIVFALIAFHIKDEFLREHESIDMKIWMSLTFVFMTIAFALIIEPIVRRIERARG